MSVDSKPITDKQRGYCRPDDAEIEQLAIEFYDRFYRSGIGMGPLYSCRKKAAALLERFSLDKIREFITILTDC